MPESLFVCLIKLLSAAMCLQVCHRFLFKYFVIVYTCTHELVTFRVSLFAVNLFLADMPVLHMPAFRFAQKVIRSFGKWHSRYVCLSLSLFVPLQFRLLLRWTFRRLRMGTTPWEWLGNSHPSNITMDLLPATRYIWLVTDLIGVQWYTSFNNL